MANTLKVRRGTKASIPTLAAGELGFCTDTLEFYVGTGSSNVKVGPFGNMSGSGTSGYLPKFTGTNSIGNSSVIESTYEVKINKAATLKAEYNNGSKSTSFTVDWRNGNKQKVTLTGSGLTCSLTDLSSSAAASGLTLKIIQDATGNRTITSWDSAIKWAGGQAPVLSTGANKVDIATFYWDGTYYWGILANNFA